MLRALVLALVALAWYNRFIQDDAFISLRYAENLVAGHGLVWNPGEYVEGYSNFLWTLALTVPFLVGVDPLLFAEIAGLLLFACTLFTTAWVARLLFGRERLAILAVVLLGTNFSFSSYATGGLETQAVALLWITTTGLAVGAATPVRLLALGSLAALALLTRMDSAVWLVGLLAVLLLGLVRAGRLRDVALVLGPSAVALLVWFAWRLGYYGELLPNTYYVKLGSETSILRGLYYLAVFFTSYLILPIAALFAVFAVRVPLRSPALWALNAPLFLWMLYLVGVGGDFMEFRFVVPMMPALFIALAWTVDRLAGRPVWQGALVGMLLVGSLGHGLFFDRSPLKRGFESIPRLDSFVTRPDTGWGDIGRLLGRSFGPEDGVSVAVSPAGAIPYYSRLPTIDMLGLNDRWVARNGLLLGDRPGHQRIAPIHYLVERGVVLVLGHPVVRPSSTDAVDRALVRHMFLDADDLDVASLPATARMLAIPASEDSVVVALYLTPHPAVDALLERQEWRELTLR